jgi:hypothetical protein
MIWVSSYVAQIFLPNYGWPHQQAGAKYSSGENSFRQTISARIYSDRGFSVIVDRTQRKVAITFDAAKIASHHEEWKESVKTRIGLEQLDPQPYWGFDDLFYKLGSKLHNCFFVKAERKRENKKEFFHYKQIMMLRELSQSKFIAAIESGKIYVDFDARTGHNHGTKFRMTQSVVPSLYGECHEL